MFIPKEQKDFEALCPDLSRAINTAKEHAETKSKKLDEVTMLYFEDDIEKVRKPSYKSKGIKVENGVLTKGNVKNEIIYIPDTVSEIGADAFNIKHCDISKVIFPAGLKKIAAKAFCGRDTIYELCVKDADMLYPITSPFAKAEDNVDQHSTGFSTFPDTLREIGDYAFKSLAKNAYYFNKRALDFLILPESLTKIGKGAFTECNITNIYIAAPHTISESCFSSSRALKRVYLGDKVEVIGSMAFDACGSVEEVVLSKNLKEIGFCAFSGCSKLENITLPDSLTKIGGYAFCECSSLTSITLPNSVTELQSKAFFGCTKLARVTLSENLTEIPDECFAHCKELTEIVIPSSIKTIAKNAFMDCGKLTFVAPANSFAHTFATENNIPCKEPNL